MIHIGVVNTVLSGLVRGGGDTSGSRRPTLGSLLLYNLEYSAYIILDPKIQEYLTKLVRVGSYHDRDDQYGVLDKTKRSR
jgi:hypothetical protein